MLELAYSYTCQVNTESNTPGNNNSSDIASNGLQRAQTLHGRTGGPVRPVLKRQWTIEEDEMLAIQHFNREKCKIAESSKDRTDQKPGTMLRAKGQWSNEDEMLTIQHFNLKKCKIAESSKDQTDQKPGTMLRAKGQWLKADKMSRLTVQHVQRFKGKSSVMIGIGENSTLQCFKEMNWIKAVECSKDRTDFQRADRLQKLRTMYCVKGLWLKEEDEVIIELVKKYGQKRWCTIAAHLPGHTDKQCQERWHNHLNPNINKEAWTHDEELALIRAHQIYGNNWAELTKFLPGRTENAIENHWNSSVEKKMDMYVTSGLLSQFRGLSLVSCPNHSAASSLPEAQQCSEDYSSVKGGAELRSQGLNNC